MSNESTSGEGQGKGGEGQSVDVKEVMKRLEELETSNKRLLDESKSWKDKAKNAEKEREEAEKKKAQESGDLAKQLELERKEKEKLMNESKSIRSKTLKQNIRNAVSSVAKDVHDLDDVLNQPQFAKILEEGIDTENLTVSEDAVKNYVNKVFETKPWLKKNVHQETVDTTKPNYEKKTVQETLKGKSSGDILKEMKNLK